MTQEEIIEMAKQAGIKCRTDILAYVFHSEHFDGIIDDDLEAFARLVAEKEREACARFCDNKAIRYAERGALPEKLRDIDPKNAVVASQVCGHIAYEIRARGQA
jgi:succinate dehydrogenase flavin-adding protein (antitoxin of CptAB toxin-antitoxin module)